ncbi:N-acetyl-alpha-D-glucosaminyl L-malate deacetylase 1 [Neolewinella maritima]|uniref:N-acetyl-alpha-D-glucosaminyl L-malate deacetylase 1 n=1 Tax=Neolewinella maritima TaxID=1383882 RepID=A0ABN8F9A2_9BACT|nr:bacillithiol biosynthesis deacetylase BshB1 [Neolewinella maritima]CAH1002157.1 N-acetyl-alpha-D-glucosaminyl L-malate deacetylase 1 [Neolewinella maritima]
MKVTILAIGVHPDDIELSCAGTLLRHAAQGHTFGILDLTRGELGTRGTAEIRTQEAFAAAKKLGARFRENLDLPDGFVQGDKQSMLKIISVIRDCQPDIVLANALSDRHPDHGRAAKIIADASYYSGLQKIETYNLEGDIQEKWRPRAVYHYIQDRNRTPDFVVDITAYFQRKTEAIACYASQFNAHESTDYAGEPSTPISGKDFMDYLHAKARALGREAGYELAEGFNIARQPGVRDLLALD